MTLLESSHSALSIHADDVMLDACYGMVSLGGNYFTSVQCYTQSFATVIKAYWLITTSPQTTILLKNCCLNQHKCTTLTS